MTEMEKDETIIRAIAYIFKDPMVNREIWQLLTKEIFRLMAKVDALEKRTDMQELDAKITNRK